MEGVDRGLAGLDARRVRFHDLSADHGADRQGIRRSLTPGTFSDMPGRSDYVHS
jgi:hypothetical protein